MNDQQRAAMQMALEALERHTECYEYPDGWITEEEKAIAALRSALAQPQGEWVDLTDDEMQDCHCLNGTAYPFALAIIAKFKEKNTPPVVPQGEPVGYLVYSLDGVNFQDSYCEGAEPVYTTPPVVPQGEPVAWMLEQGDVVEFEYRDYHEGSEWTPLYTTPPSVEAAIEATKEKAARVCEQYSENLFSRNRMEESAGVLHIAAAIRSMK